jgi:electron transfer flavoprotein alpha subunit
LRSVVSVHLEPPVRIAVLVKQIPVFEEMQLDEDGRLRRDGVELEMNPYCRRAVAQACLFATDVPDTSVVVFTLGPACAEDALREAIAWGIERDIDISAVHITDPAFAGSDTLATARALAAALRREGPFDLVLAGRNSVDADTGQVAPELAELLDLPFLTGIRAVTLEQRRVRARCELDDGWLEADLDLPAILTCAERLCDPAKVDPDGRAAVPAERIRRLAATDLDGGPWGQDGSPTRVGPVKLMALERAHHRFLGQPLDEQVRAAVAELTARGALTPTVDTDARITVAEPYLPARTTAVVAEPARAHETRELLGAAAALGGRVVAITVELPDPALLSTWGADEVVHVQGSPVVEVVEEDVAQAVGEWADAHGPWAVLTASTAFGREVASRTAARLGAGLTGDAVELDVEGDRLVAWKPAFGGQLVAAIHTSSPVQMATVRPGVLPTFTPRPARSVPVGAAPVTPRGRVRVHTRTRNDDLDVLAEAHVVIGVGTGVHPDEYPDLEPLRELLQAELGATRKVTDKGWLPRSRQIGITGRAIAPRLFVSIGASGKFNHTVGVRAARTVLAINPDPDAPIWSASDVGIVGDWHEALPLLVAELRRTGVT